MPRLLEHIDFPKVVTILAVVFGISLGACGVTALAGSQGRGEYILPLGMVELAVIALSAVALFIAVVIWIVVEAIGDRSAGVPGTIRLFDESDEDKLDR